jgi:hypothetical protein
MTYTITHKRKLHEVRTMLTRKEVREHTSPFDGARWVKRRDKRSDRMLELEDAAVMRREATRLAHAEELAQHGKRLDGTAGRTN